jgi:hypothetical protein
MTLCARPEKLSKGKRGPSTASTALPDFIAENANADDRLAASSQGSAILRAIELLQTLAAAIVQSHDHLLRLDLQAIESGTRDQLNLMRQFAAIQSELEYELTLIPATESSPKSSAIPTLQSAQPGRQQAKRLRVAALRVIHAARLQSALLERAQRKLRIVANLLAEPGACYLPPTSLQRESKPWVD